MPTKDVHIMTRIPTNNIMEQFKAAHLRISFNKKDLIKDSWSFKRKKAF